MGGVDVVKIKYPSDGWMGREAQTSMESSLIEGHLARVNRHYGLIVLGEPGLFLGQKRSWLS